MRAVQERPGATSAELAAVSGVQRNTLYGLLTRLVKDGELQTRALPTGALAYALTSTPPSKNAMDGDRSALRPRTPLRRRARS